MKILVTGGLGFIGSNFVRHMHDSADIVVVDAQKYGSNPANVKDLEYEFVKGDICDYELMCKLVKETDAVVNFAAETHVDRSISSPYSFIVSNVNGTYTVLEAIRTCNPDARLVHISTDEVYGDIEVGSFKEDDILRPSSPYSASKASADLIVLAYVRTYAINAVITRCTNNYGRYQFPEKLIPKAIIRAISNMKIPIYGTGKNVRDWIFVEDHCEAIKMVLNKGEKGEIYNVASGAEKTNLELVSAILAIMDKPDLVEFVEDRPGHDLRYSLDYSKAMELGWKPRHKFEKGLEETIEWYLSNEWWWKSLADDKVLHPTPWKLEW